MRLGLHAAALLVGLGAPMASTAPSDAPLFLSGGGGLGLCERNPRYLSFRGQPALLVGSGEHYGAAVNLDFDYRKYLETVRRDRQNLVRIWSGTYREHPGSFGIPMNARNNVNGIGDVPGSRAYDLGNASLTRVQKDLVRRLIGELREAENVYFEIVNEGYHWFGPVPRDWQDEMLRTADDARRETGSRALLAENVAQGRKRVTRLSPATSILNFHYASPPHAVEENLHLGRPIAFDEDGFDQPGDWTYRENAWEFLMAGGAVYDNLDYSFAVGHEDGTAVQENAPGWGGASFRRQLRILREFLESFDLPALVPRTSLVVGGAANGAEVTQEGTARAWALADEGREYAVYLTRRRIARVLLLEVAPGAYGVEWLAPRTGERRDGGTAERRPGALVGGRVLLEAAIAPAHGAAGGCVSRAQRKPTSASW